MEYPWDEETRTRQIRLIYLALLCVVVLAFFYLGSSEDLENKNQEDPGRNERISRCC